MKSVQDFRDIQYLCLNIKKLCLDFNLCQGAAGAGRVDAGQRPGHRRLQDQEVGHVPVCPVPNSLRDILVSGSITKISIRAIMMISEGRILGKKERRSPPPPCNVIIPCF